MQVKLCRCGSGHESYLMYDARGIPCGFVCEKCEEKKKKTYRSEIFSNPNYDADEPIDYDY